MGAFVGYDGRGAEVWVQTGPGKIVELDDSRDKSARVTVLGEGLKHKTHGWIAKSDPLFAKVKEAFDQKRSIEYRIESQRKSTVDPKVPIQALRESMEKAKDNTTQIFAGLDGELSTEAVTDPKKDLGGGRVRATDVTPPTPGAVGPSVGVETLLSAVSEARAKNAAESFVSALMAQAVAAGASVDEALAAASGKRVSALADDDQSQEQPRQGRVTRQSTDKPSTPAEKVTQEQSEPETPTEDDSSVEIFAPIEDDPTAPRATNETVDALRALVTEAEVTDMSLVSGILKNTFGIGVARQISDDNLGDFIDFYVAHGPENFRAALEKVAKG